MLPATDGLEVTAFCGLGSAPAEACDGPAGLPIAEPLPREVASVLRIGGAILGEATKDGLDYAASVTPIPLPAAGWLVLAGLGALGLAGRRRRGALPTLRRRRMGVVAADQFEPLGASLRASALTDTTRFFGARVRFARRPDRGWQRDLAQRMRVPWPHSAFPPGRAEPARPCGAAAHRYPATAERAPPVAGDVDARPIETIVGTGVTLVRKYTLSSPPRVCSPRTRGGSVFGALPSDPDAGGEARPCRSGPTAIAAHAHAAVTPAPAKAVAEPVADRHFLHRRHWERGSIGPIPQWGRPRMHNTENGSNPHEASSRSAQATAVMTITKPDDNAERVT